MSTRLHKACSALLLLGITFACPALAQQAQVPMQQGTATWGVMLAPTTLVQSRVLAGNKTPLAGGGLSAEISRQLSWRGRKDYGSSLFVLATAGTVGNDGDQYDMSALAFGVRMPLQPASRRWRSFVALGGGVRFAATVAADALESRRVEAWSPVLTSSVGQTVSLAKNWSLHVALQGAVGPWSRWERDDDSRPPNEATTAGRPEAVSGEFLLGLRWGR